MGRLLSYLILNFSAACEQALGLRSRMGRKERGKRKVGVGEGKKAGRGGEPVDKGL